MIHTIPGNKTMLWHQRLRHSGQKGLQTLHDKGMVEGMSNCTLDFDLCEHYIDDKHTLECIWKFYACNFFY
jgi:hypothetical protein